MGQTREAERMTNHIVSEETGCLECYRLLSAIYSKQENHNKVKGTLALFGFVGRSGWPLTWLPAAQERGWAVLGVTVSWRILSTDAFHRQPFNFLDTPLKKQVFGSYSVWRFYMALSQFVFNSLQRDEDWHLYALSFSMFFKYVFIESLQQPCTAGH